MTYLFLIQETSKLVSAANSAIVQVTKSSGHLPFCAEPPSNDHSPDHSIVTGSVIASKNGLPSKAATKSTLSDLLETLKKLEEDEKLGTGKMNVNKNSRKFEDILFYYFGSFGSIVRFELYQNNYQPRLNKIYDEYSNNILRYI